jgi:hypothetical protein
MTRLAAVALIFAIWTGSVKAGQYVRKPVNFQPNSILSTGGDSDAPASITGALITNGSSFTVNGTSLTKANRFTLANGNTCSVVYEGTSANQVAVITLTRFALPGLKSAAGPQANGSLLATLPAGAQIVAGGAFNTLKLFTVNGAAAIKSNGTVLALGSAKAGGANKTLVAAGATTYNIFTGQQIQQNGRTLNAITTGVYGTATGGTKTIYLNTANGYPAASVGTQYVNGTVVIPLTNAY